MSQKSLQDCFWPQTRKRPFPALAPEISDNDSEDPECRSQGQKVPKLSNGAKDELTLEITHIDSHRETISCYGPLGGLSPTLVPLASKDEPILSLRDNVRSSNSHSNPSSSPLTQTQPTSVNSEYESLLPFVRPILV